MHPGGRSNTFFRISLLLLPFFHISLCFLQKSVIFARSFEVFGLKNK